MDHGKEFSLLHIIWCLPLSDKLTAGLLKILSLNIRKLGLANCLKHKSEDEQYKFCGVGHWLVIQCEHKVLGNL